MELYRLKPFAKSGLFEDFAYEHHFLVEDGSAGSDLWDSSVLAQMIDHQINGGMFQLVSRSQEHMYSIVHFEFVEEVENAFKPEYNSVGVFDIKEKHMKYFEKVDV